MESPMVDRTEAFLADKDPLGPKVGIPGNEQSPHGRKCFVIYLDGQSAMVRLASDRHYGEIDPPWLRSVYLASGRGRSDSNTTPKPGGSSPSKLGS